MKILVAYATTDGQTRKIARFVADHLVSLGHSTELLNLADAEGLDLARFDAAVLAGSLHIGIYQDALTSFAQSSAQVLNAMPTLFLPVSLSAAGDDADDWKGLETQTTAFLDETGWRPTRVEHVAGAFRFTEYDFFRAWAMRRIAKAKGETVDPKADKEYTDWSKLATVLSDWCKGPSA
jgi:menaquinone-dependent protoporphyrinogen oxidase